MIFKCPRCGKEYSISNISDPQMILRCVDHDCRHVFTVAQAEIVTTDDSARIEEEKKVRPAPVVTDMEQFVNDHEGVAKALAQDYFSDIPSEETGEAERQEAATEDLGEGTPDQQRQRLYQLAQEHPDEVQETPAQQNVPQPRERKTFSTRNVHEKRGQRVGCFILLFLAVAVFAGRVLLTRMQGTEQQFRYLEAQIVPSCLYLCTVLVVIVHVLRYTAKPKWISAALMLLPLAADAWYMFPQTLNLMPAETWFTVNSVVKVVFSLFGLLRSIRAGKRPAKKYRPSLT